jgi:hypothetical protein
MPLHVDIRVNDLLINQLHIGRTKGGTSPDDMNEYIVVDGDRPRSHSDWYAEGVPFNHRYGDGAEVCVMKAIEAMRGNNGKTTRS